MLFYGALGTGKTDAAMTFAKSCNCSSANPLACNSCGSCRKIDSGMHPDILFVGPEKNKKQITISQVRDIGRAVSAKPNEALYRMIYIRDADLMNVQAQNGLLKALEEPPENTFFILIATTKAPLLPTILSRCRQIRFSSMPLPMLEEALCRRYRIDPRTARIICRSTGADAEDALGHAGEGEDEPGAQWLRFRKWLIGAVCELVAGPRRDRVAKGLALARTISADPGRLPDALAIIRTVFRDLCILRYSPEQIVNLDFFDVFKDISGIYVYPTFLGWMAAFFETEKRLDSNSGQRLTLDRFFLELSFS